MRGPRGGENWIGAEAGMGGIFIAAFDARLRSKAGCSAAKSELLRERCAKVRLRELGGGDRTASRFTAGTVGAVFLRSGDGNR